MANLAWSRARYAITLGGASVDDRIAPFLMRVEVVLNEEADADTATILLSDTIPGTVPPMPAFALPPKGTPVTIALGAEPAGVTLVFTGFVETARSRGDRGGGRSIEIRCTSLDTTSDAKSPKTRHKDRSSLKDAAADFGTAGGLSIEVHASLGAITRPYWAMDGESAIGWGRRVAREVGGLFKVVGTQGVIVPKGAGLSASGQALPPISVTYGVNVISWDLAPDAGRPPFAEVNGRWYDPAQAKWLEKTITVTGGTGSTRQSIRHSRADEAEAGDAATAEGKDQEHEKGGGTVEIDGLAGAQAGAPVIVSGLHPDIDRTYTAKAVTHALDRARGFVTRLELARPQG
ncbi:phage late control D family protein [Prosthecomicrobium hirschii]|uniref:phage late control D family protein n=1 Tax=Prosthecodimorpha hirschii TaxID=665126 RepID=UPI002221205F|nr:hypothetical protein [Prosthecomicrobium hirschii]MCW1842234.1 hypothetical protein [Prosthecomicrobium hirschii]